MATITSTTRTDALGILAGPVFIDLKGTWGSGSVGVYYTTKKATDTSLVEADWSLLHDIDGASAVTADKNYTTTLPSGSISFKASVAPTSITADVIQLQNF